MDKVTRILICGSSEAITPEMIDLTQRAVKKAAANGWQIVVGDADGVSQAAVEELCRLGYRFECYGVTPDPKPPKRSLRSAIQSEFSKLADYHLVDGRNFNRDKTMVKAADLIYVVWNGYSAGTEHLIEYAQRFRAKKLWVRPNGK